MGWKDIFMMSKQTEAFHELLAEQSRVGVQMANLLRAYIQETDPSKRNKIAQDASDLEHLGDRYRIQILDQLKQTFVTPFDREDINDLSRSLDDIVDYAENTIKELSLYEISISETITTMVDILCEGTVVLDSAVRLLGKSPSEASDLVAKVKSCENRMEGTYRRGIAALSEGEDVLYLIKLREVYRHLSNSADHMDEAANSLMRIAIKGSK